MNFIDYYKVLGIDKSATVSDIKKAYRKQASKYHPDLNPNDADANKNFQQINEANEVLSDPDKRKKYDKYGKDWQHAEQFENAKQYQEQASDSRGQKYSRAQSGGDFSDFFESMFGCRQPKKVQLEDMMLGMVFMISLTWGNSTRKDLFEPGMEHVMSTWPA